MPSGNEFPLSIVLRALDRATGPIVSFAANLEKAVAPAKRMSDAINMHMGGGLANVTARMAPMADLFRGLWRDVGGGRMQRALGGLKDAFGRVGEEVKGLGIGAAGFFGVASFGAFELVKSAAEAGTALERMSKRTGISVQAFAGLQFAAKTAGVGAEEFAGAMDKFSRNLGMAKNNAGPLFTLLRGAAPVFLNQLRNAKNTEEAFGLMANAVLALKDPTERAELVMTAFGRGSAPLIEMLAKGKIGLKELQAEFTRLAGDQTKFAEGAEHFTHAWERLTTAFEGIRNAVGAVVFDRLAAAMGRLTGYLSAHRGAIADFADKFVAKAVKALPQFVIGVETLGNALGVLWSVLGPPIKGLAEFAGTATGAKTIAYALAGLLAGKLILAVGGLGLALAQLSIVLATTPIGWVILAFAGLAAAAVLVVKNWEPIKAFFARLWDGIVKGIHAFQEKVRGLWDALPSPPDWLKRLWNADLGAGLRGLMPDSLGGATPGDATVRPWYRAPTASGPPLLSSGRAPGSARTETTVKVQFENMPRGTRVKSESRGPADVDLSLGYAFAEVP